MIGIPPGWTWVELSDIVEILDYGRVPVDAKERASRRGSVPYYGATGQVGWIDEALFNEDLVLLGEDGVQFFDPGKSKSYLIAGPSWVNNHAHVLRAQEHLVDRRYLCHYLNTFDYRGYANGTTRLKLTQSAMRTIPVPLPPRTEQRRILAVLEDHLSRLDSAVSSVQSALRKQQRLTRRLVDARLDALNAPTSPLVSVLREPLINGRSVPTDSNGFPVLRLTALRDGRLALSERKSGRWTAADAAPFLVRRGDFFISRGNGSLALVGRGALLEVEPDLVAFPDTMIRIRVDEQKMSPEFLRLAWDSRLIRSQIEKNARTTAGIHKINQRIVRGICIPVPGMPMQKQMVSQVHEVLDGINRVGVQIRLAVIRAKRLRRLLLADAFAGRLVEQNPADEPPSVLLERIRALHVAQGPAWRSRRGLGETEPENEVLF